MSNAIKQVFIIGAVIAISMVFIIQFRPGSTDVSTGSGPSCAIENNGACIITQSDFVTAYRLAAPGSMDNDAFSNQLRVLIIEGLVQRWLLNEDAKRLGVSVSSKDVTLQLSNGLARVSLPVDQQQFAYYIRLVPPPQGPARQMAVKDPRTDKFDYERYQKWVQRSSAKTEKDFKAFQTREAIAARMRALIEARVRVSETEAFADYAHRNLKAVVDFLKLERGWYKKYIVDQSDDAIDAWAKENKSEIDEAYKAKKDSYSPECRRARQILIRVDDTEVDKEAAKKKARAKLDAALKRIKRGDKFADVAKAVSEDATSAPEGGDLGCFAAGKLAKPSTTKAVDDAAFKLKKGKISDVIETSFGVHVVQLVAVLKGAKADAWGRRFVARDLYLRKKADSLSAEAGKQIRAAVAAGKTLQQALDTHLQGVMPPAAKLAFEEGRAAEAAKKDKKDGDEEKPSAALNAWTDAGRPRIETSSPFAMAGPPFGGVENPVAATKMVFAIEKVGGVASDLVKLYDGYAVAQLKEKQPVAQKDWDEKRVEHIARMRRDKQRDALVSYVHRLREQLAKSLIYKIKLRLEEKDDKKKKKG